MGSRLRSLIAHFQVAWLPRLRTAWALSMVAALALAGVSRADEHFVDEPLRAVIPRAKESPKIDGQLLEYDDAFSAPVEYFHTDLKNRAAQFYYLWDDAAFYVGVRTLDEHPFAPEDPFWVGDAVEFYLDTRPEPVPSRLAWGSGAVHCFFTPLDRDQLSPRFSLRPGYEDAIPQIGIQVSGRQTKVGLEYEFKLPWANFPNFKPELNKEIHLDTELSYSDGISRSFRTFAFGGPLSVECPANLARVKFVERFERSDWGQCGSVLMPIRVDVPWDQRGKPQVSATIAMPPSRSKKVGKIAIQLVSTTGKVIAEIEADSEEVFEPLGGFARRTARWPTSLAAPGAYHVQAIVYDARGVELTRVAPRMVSVNLAPGY